MTKIGIEGLVCPEIVQAYENAQAKVLNNLPYPASGNRWPSEFGNHVTTKGGGEETSACRLCKKKLKLNIKFQKIQAKDEEEKTITLYHSIGGEQSVSVSGKVCAEVLNQK